MGTDIHIMVEVKKEYEEGWEALTAPIFKHPYYDETLPLGRDNYPFTVDPYKGRNYRLFAALADVRNGVGFAGIVTGVPILPVADPRGVPADATDEWNRMVASWGRDMHSISYLTLAELDAYDWNQPMAHVGVVSAEQYAAFRDEGTPPESWYGDGSGGGLSIVTPEQYEAGERGERRTDVRITWVTPLHDDVRDFVDHTIPSLKLLADRIGQRTHKRGEVDERPLDLESVRLMFGFDN